MAKKEKKSEVPKTRSSPPKATCGHAQSSVHGRGNRGCFHGCAQGTALPTSIRFSAGDVNVVLDIGQKPASKKSAS